MLSASRRAHTQAKRARQRCAGSSRRLLAPVPLPLPSQTPLYSTTVSKALPNTLRSRAVSDFRELSTKQLGQE
jgi:hypothetical protein